MSQTVGELNLFPHSWNLCDSCMTDVILLALCIYFLFIYSAITPTVKTWVSFSMHIKEIYLSWVQWSTVWNSSSSFTSYISTIPVFILVNFSEFLNIIAASANMKHTKQIFSLHLSQWIHTNDHLIIQKCQEETKLTQEQELSANQLLYVQYRLN